MTTPNSTTVLNNTRALFWLAAVIGALLLNSVLLIGNLLATSTALELAGYEKQPLIDESAFGDTLGQILPEGTVAHLLAIGITGGITLGMFAMAHLLHTFYLLFEEYRELRRVGDESRAARAGRMMRERLFWMAMLLPSLALVLQWDVFLQIYRQVAFALAPEAMHTGEVASLLPHWDQLTGAAANLATVRISLDQGALGYLGLSVLPPLLLEFCIHQLQMAWAARQQAQNPAQDEPTAPARVAAEPTVPQVDSDTDRSTQTSAQTPHLEPAPTGAVRDIEPRAAAAVTSTKIAQPVVGGRPGESVTLAEAQADSARYHVDPATRQVWARAYWQALHADT